MKNGMALLIPFLIIRFGVMAKQNKSALKRAAHFPQMKGIEIFFYYIYQFSNIAFFVYICCCSICIDYSWSFFTGIICYIIGLILCIYSVLSFSKPNIDGVNMNGFYRFSRNPMYLSYFICFLGCAGLTQSIMLLGIVIIFQISSHWIILSEERWCITKFGDKYKRYMSKVRRYI